MKVVAKSEWRDGDPREFFNKRGEIIILGPTGISQAQVETHHAYCIWLNNSIPGGKRKHPSFFDADDVWEPGYLWCIDPMKE